MAAPALPEGFDFTDPALAELPDKELAELRRTQPIWWNEQPQNIAGFEDDGYWVVSRHADVREISRRAKIFSSEQNTAIVRFTSEMTREQLDLQRLILLNQDDPKHAQTRRLVQRGFTPRAINALRDGLAARARAIVAEAGESGEGEFVREVASELPLQAIAELIGIPQEDRSRIFLWSNQMMGYDDPDYEQGAGVEASAQLMSYAYQMADQRRMCPADDIVSRLIAADADGNELTPAEFGFFVLVLAVAGNETTRNAITHGMRAFFDHPDQWELYKRERPSTAADEIVRWATPVTAFQRTVMEDTEISGVSMKKGQRVGIFYRSANFDEEVFDDPFSFDITRDPNPHLGFGASGPHFCLGANLARMELDLMFGAIADQMPNIKPLGEPERLRSGWLNSVKSMRVSYE